MLYLKEARDILSRELCIPLRGFTVEEIEVIAEDNGIDETRLQMEALHGETYGELRMVREMNAQKRV